MKAREPFIVFGAPRISEEEIDAVVETMRSGWLGTGPRAQAFERAIADYTGSPQAVAVNSCTAALHLALLESGMGDGDEVITTPLTFAATANSILHTGATPVFVDPDRTTQNIEPAAIEAAITDRTRMILPVHFAGRPCNMDGIEAIAKARGLRVIEDAAHALEAKYRGRKVGSISPLTCFSFYVTKNITTVEGGMLCVKDQSTSDRLHTLALHGLSGDAWARFSDKGYKHYQVVSPGYKYNMTDMQAAMGLIQLRHIDRWLERRVELWDRYNEAFADLPCLRPADPEPDTVHARHLYTLMIDVDNAPVTRDEFMVKMRELGVGTGVHYRALHLHPYYAERFGLRPEDFPNAYWLSERTVSLPLSQRLTDSEADRVIDATRHVLLGR